MTTEEYAYARYLVGTAVNQVALRPTLHEGLFIACVDYLIWLDVSRDLPESLVGDFTKWRSGLLPEQQHDDAYDYVLSAVRNLSSRRILTKVEELQALLTALQAHENVSSARRTTPPFMLSL